MELRPEDFISLARHDLRRSVSRPSQVALRRALSTVYYAMFHTLAKNGADLLVGAFEEPLTKAFVESRINRAERLIRDFNATHKKDRRAFSIYVLLRMRDSG